MRFTSARDARRGAAGAGRRRPPGGRRQRPRRRRAPGQGAAARARSSPSTGCASWPGSSAERSRRRLAPHRRARPARRDRGRARWSPRGSAALADGSALVGSPSTRNVGTLGGNVMNGSPAMDTGAPLVVLGAEVELRSAAGRAPRRRSRRCGPGPAGRSPSPASCAWRSTCRRRERGAPGSARYVRLEYRRAMEIAVVGAAACGRARRGRHDPAACRIALAAVAPTIIRAPGGRARDHRPAARAAGARGRRRRRGRGVAGRSATCAPARRTAATPSASSPAARSTSPRAARAARPSPSPPTGPAASARPSEVPHERDHAHRQRRRLRGRRRAAPLARLGAARRARA